MRVPRCASWWVVILVGVLLPLAASLVTYTLITLENDPITLDEKQALVFTIFLIKLLLVGGTGVFPIDLNALFTSLTAAGRKKRHVSAVDNHVDNQVVEPQMPEGDWMPCVRRFLCELEMTARTKNEGEFPVIDFEDEDEHPEEDVVPPEVDPVKEMHIEALRALLRETDPSGELSDRGSRALNSLEALTGKSCETVYRLCPGRFTPSTAFSAVFDELDLKVHDEF